MSVLIIRNLRDVDAAAKLLYFDIQTKVGAEMDRCAKEWADSAGWVGEYALAKDETICFGPKGWRAPGSGSKKELFRARFHFQSGEGDDWNHELDYFWLTRLCQAGNGVVGFRWLYDLNQIGASKRDWKNFVGLHVPSIKQAGFEYEEKNANFFTPFCIDQEELAKCFQGGVIADSMKPMRDALNRLHSAQPLFDDLLSQAAKKFGNGGTA
jgi:hypothetical protein